MIRRKRQEEEEEEKRQRADEGVGKRKVHPNASSSSSSHRLVGVVLFFASFAVVCSKSVRFYFEHFNNSSSSLSLSLSSLPPGNPMIFSKEEGKEEEEDDDDEEKEEDTNNNVFGDLRENDLVETPFKRLRKTTKTTTTISKSILTKMKDLPMMDIFSSSSSSSSSSSNNNNNKKKQYETCALVGTAAIVTDAQRGGEIDANDAVFRTDDAPTKRYEQFVGRRATYRIVSGGGGSRSSSSSSTSSFFEDIVSSGEAVKEKSIVTIGTTMTTTSSSSMEGESEDESAGGNGDEGEDRKVMKKYTSPFAKYLVALDDVAKEKIREALSLTDEENDENDDDEGEEGRGDQLTHAIALDATFADAIREAYTTAGALLNDLGENFKIRQTPPVGAFALFFALSKCNRLTLYGVPSPDSNRLETQPYWPRKTKTESGGKPTKIDIFGDRVLYALVRLFALEGFVDVVN